MDALLEELCTKYGWCLSPDHRSALVTDAPQESEQVVDSIIRAEFGDVEPQRRTWLTPIVNDWLFDPAGRGARSGLPR